MNLSNPEIPLNLGISPYCSGFETIPSFVGLLIIEPIVFSGLIFKIAYYPSLLKASLFSVLIGKEDVPIFKAYSAIFYKGVYFTSSIIYYIPPGPLSGIFV